MIRILLQDKKTGMYYVHSDGWSANSADAFDFLSAELAIQMARSFRLARAEIIYSVKDETFNFTLPLSLEFT